MPVVTGLQLVDAVKADVESFFPNREGFVVYVEFTGLKPSCRGTGDKCRICLPAEFQDIEISDLDALHFWLITLGHEIAHYLNRHNDFNVGAGEAKFETRSIEDWADFYGTKLMMSLIIFGERTQAIYTGYEGAKNFKSRIESMARALCRLATTFFDFKSQKYAPRMTRVASCVNGINSFLDKLKGMEIRRSIWVMQTVFLSPQLKPIFEKEDLEFPESIEQTVTVHQAIQGPDPAISVGLAEWLEPFIGTNFITTPEERRQYTEAVRKISKDQGLDIAPFETLRKM